MNDNRTQIPQEIEEGAGKNALVGLAALTAMCLPASAKTGRSASAGRNAPIVQSAFNPVRYSGYTKRQAKNIIARTIFVEAQGEGNKGLGMVATVIWNRANGNPSKMVDVCKAASQFSCWKGMTQEEWNPKTFQEKERTGTIWEASKALADSMFSGTFKPLGGYTHYYANRGPNAIDTPYWAVGANGYQLKNHIFFTSEELDRAKRMVAKR